MKIVNEVKEWLLIIAYVFGLIFLVDLGDLILKDYKQSIDKVSIEIDEDNVKAQTFLAELELIRAQIKKTEAEWEKLK